MSRGATASAQPSEAPPATLDRGRRVNPLLAFTGGMGLGAGLAVLLNGPWRRRRLALARDQAVHLVHVAGETADETSRDVRNRARGVLSKMWGRRDGRLIDDVTLAARVRSQLGRVSSHPSAIAVLVHDGRVTLTGTILEREFERALHAVSSVPGVREVTSRLEVYEHAGHISALQGEPARREERFEYLQEHWAPAARAAAVLAGAALAFYGVRRRDRAGAAAGVAGVGLLARAVTNQPVKRLTGIGAGCRAVDVQKDITIDAPVERVFGVWSQVQSFPRFMAHVREVRVLADGRTRWTVAGPAGLPVRWDAVLTRSVPNQVIAWKTTRGSLIGHAGIVRFDPNPDGSTRVDVKMSYNPVLGALGHLVARLSGVDPKQAMDEDLARFKTLVEQGKTTAHGEEVTIEELAPMPR